MRAVATLLLVFGAISVTYLLYWAKRATVAVADANAIFKETGSITRTAKQMLAEQSMPDKYRLSQNQQRFLQANHDDFMVNYHDAIFRQCVTLWEKWEGEQAGRSISNEEAKTASDAILFLASVQHAKLYCEIRGIA